MRRLRSKLPLSIEILVVAPMLSEKDIDRIMEMAWEDRTPFEAIRFQFGLAEKEVIALMRKHLKRNSFERWRKRVNSGISQKHLKLRDASINRFKCSRQRVITHNKISKRLGSG
ncbi:MAG: TIGR03643 family protein [Chitinophagales bacterium]